MANKKHPSVIVAVSFLLTFLFSQVMLLVYGLGHVFKKKRK